MFCSGVINHQPHAGLQKVSALAGLARSSLGPCKSYKFLQEEGSGEASLACSCARLLEALELSCAVGQLVSEAVRTHHALFRSGSACLLFMAGAWSCAALECLRRGVPARSVVHAMREGLDVCLQACRDHRVPLDRVSTPRRSPSLSTAARRPPPTGPGKIKLTHSRYFSEAATGTASPTPAQSPGDIGAAARALGHGRARAVDLVLQAGRLQSAHSAAGPALEVSSVVTCALAGVPEERACVLPGCVVRLPADRAALCQLLEGRSLRVVMVTGDLCRSYRHLGSKRPPGVSHVTGGLDGGGSGGEARWTRAVLTALRRLGVDLVLASGAASEALGPLCLAQRVLLVDRVVPAVLRALAEATGAVPVAYAAQLSERCVGTGGTVTPCGDLAELQAVSVSARAGVGLVTAVLTSCVPAKLQALEDEFWAVAHSVHHALSDGALLPGAGAIETVCVHRLQRLAKRPLSSREAGSLGLYRETVLMLMADALTDYVATVMANSGRSSKVEAWTAVGEGVRRLARGSGVRDPGSGRLEGGVAGEAAHGVYDCLRVKVEAWRRAMELVLLVLQTDAEVISGVHPETLRTRPDFMPL